MEGYQSYFFVTESGRRPVKEFILSLDESSQNKFDYIKKLLEENGHKLKYPYSKYLGKSIFELRFKAAEGNIRILYFFFGKSTAIFTNSFIKKSEKTPKREIEIALRRRKACLIMAERGGLII